MFHSALIRNISRYGLQLLAALLAASYRLITILIQGCRISM